MNSTNFKPNVLHLLHKSFPVYVGYTIRSQFILSHQKKFANPYALTRPFFIRKNKIDFFNNVIYFRYPKNFFEELIHYFCFSKYFNAAKYYNEIYYSLLKIPKNFILKIVKKKKIDLIHGHTPYLFANLGEIVAHKIGIPFIYEVRGFWEDTNVILGFYKENDEQYHKIQQKETQLMNKSAAVITLGKMMRKELIKRGVNKNKIYIIPNAVDIKYFQPIPPDPELKKNLKINNKHVIAYIGSIRKIEGLETLIKAISIVKKKIKDVKVLLIGGGDERYCLKLEKLIKELGLNGIVFFTGPIASTEINKYYSIVDIIVIPRINARVNRIVTPLKQLEAMAMEKVVITSDLPALREMIKPGISGDIFKPNNFGELANKIIYYLTNQKAKEALALSARNFVKEYYDWNVLVNKYCVLYEKLLNKPLIC